MSDDDQEEVKENEKKKQQPKRNAKKKQKKQDRKDKTNTVEYKQFMQDLEEDKELRDQVNLYKDNDAMAELEKRMASMALEEDTRPIKKGVRKTEEGKKLEKESLIKRNKDKLIQKANLKTKEEQSSSDWESAEEDAPVV